MGETTGNATGNATGDATGDEEPGPPEPEGGDPACWLDQVCPACGRLTERTADGRCAACGEPAD